MAEEFNAVMTAISTVGFPIAACAAMFWFNVKVVTPLIEVVAKNTAIMERIEAKLGN